MSAADRVTYRAGVDAGARGFFLAPSVAVNATHLINPADRRGGYFVRRDLSDPAQGGPRERAGLLLRAQLRDVDRDRAEWDGAHPHWIGAARVERPGDPVQRGWLSWDTLGEVVETTGTRQR